MNKAEIEARKAELEEQINEATSVEQVEELRKQVAALKDEKPEEEKPAELDERSLLKDSASEVEKRSVANMKEIKKPEEERKMDMTREDVLKSKEYRGAFFKKLQGKDLNEEETRALTSGATSAGAAIPTETANALVTKMFEIAPLLSEITLLRVAGNVTVATQLDRDDAYLHGENAAITASADVLAKVTLAGYEFAKLISISKTVQTMAIDAFESWLIDGIYEDVARKIENAIIYGSGSNEPGGLASITLTANTNLISTTASITYDNICTLMTYPGKGFRKGAKFLCNSTFPFTQLAGIKDTANRPIYVESLAEGVPARLMGREVLISDEVEDDELYYGQFNKIFGNLSGDITVESSTQSGFRNGTIDYRGMAIFDCKVAAPAAFGKFVKN